MTRTVFVVDEDFDGRHALGDLLEDHGWQAVLLPGPREAVAALGCRRPALVVTELWRPATPDGASFAALLAETRRARSPVIVFTAWSTRAVTACLDITVVNKPNIRMLLPLIEAALAPPAPLAARAPFELNPSASAALTPA
jgi:DNA-binding NtrC family response regulator